MDAIQDSSVVSDGRADTMPQERCAGTGRSIGKRNSLNQASFEEVSTINAPVYGLR
jgi:hypothetical protein